MGQPESKRKIEEQFQIQKIQQNGNTLLRSKKDDKDYYMRIVSCASQADLQRLKALLQNRAQLKNRHLLSLVQIKEKQQDFICSVQYRMYLVLQYSFKNAAQQIKERTKGNQPNFFQESDLWSILYSCCQALKTLYNSGTTHECLTADQIFISSDGFIKVSEPLLFGLEKNHLQAMRTKQLGKIALHLSPEIMNCLQDQNFFYYDKEKSDIFVLGMIIVDLALLQCSYLYDLTKKRPNLDILPGLLKRVGQRYSQNLTSILAEMLRVDSKMRPGLGQIIDRIQKCNNIGQDFTVQTQSNAKSNDIESERGPEKFVFEKPIREVRIINEQIKIKNVEQGQIIRAEQQPSLSIKDQQMGLNQQNFDGKIFTSTPCHSKYNGQAILIQKQQAIPLPQNSLVNNQNNTSQFQSFRKSFDLYERSRSIDSIKVVSNDFSAVEQNKQKVIFSAVKANPFNVIDNKILQNDQIKKINFQIKPSKTPLYTYQIPQVYNIMIKNTKMAPKNDFFSNTQKQVINDKGHVSTPQFNGQIQRVNRFASIKNNPFETASKFSDSSQLQSFHQLQMKKGFSHSYSETQPRIISKPNFQLNNYGKEVQSPNVFPSNITFNVQQNQPFSGSTPFPSSRPPFANTGYSPAEGSTLNRSPFNVGSSVSYTFSPNKLDFNNNNNNFSPSKIDFKSSSFIPNKLDIGFKPQNFTCRSGFPHSTHLHSISHPDLKLQYVKQEIPQRGRYQGYKCYDQRNGHGTLFFKDGGYYEGEWKNDKMHGFGKLYYQNGTIAYEGHWEDDEFNGQGRVYNMEPITFLQQFNYKDFSELGNKWVYYEGQFKSDSKHGKGYIKLTNGQMFEGLFDHDMIEGNGIFYKRSGEIVIGFWIDNKLFLNQSYQHERK